MKPTLFHENERARSFCTYGIIGMILLLVAASLVYGDHRESNDLPREIIFAVRQPGRGGHWYENFGYSAFDADVKLYGSQGRLCRLDLRTGEMTVLLEDTEGAIRDPQVHYSGEKILFSYRPGGTDYFHLYEIGIDGKRLRRLTEGPFDDIEPTYLPNDRIMFCSSRAKRWVNCWYSQVAILYQCGPDGSNPTPISANIEHDNTPWPLPDGRVLYTRWEYVDRSRVAFHHLWTANPDGTGQTILFGNMHPGTLMIDAKPIPGSEEILAVFSPGHGRKEHMGAIAVVSPKRGPDDRSSVRTIHSEPVFRRRRSRILRSGNSSCKTSTEGVGWTASPGARPGSSMPTETSSSVTIAARWCWSRQRREASAKGGVSSLPKRKGPPGLIRSFIKDGFTCATTISSAATI